jgi:flagellin
LSGVQAIGQSGTDIGSGSASTNLATILANTTNTASEATTGTTTFYLKGPGFSGNGIQISVATANLGSTSNLVAAVNAAIKSAAGAGTQQATALQNANVVASINTDATGKQQLTFNSSTAAFQVEAGDRTANALLGNFEQNATLTGTDSNATAATNGGGSANTLTLSVNGGPTFSVNVTSGAAVSKAQIVKDLNNDTGAGLHFANYATAYLNGDQIVIKSKNNSGSSSIALTSTTLATSLGLSTTTATAASASTGASLNTYVTAATNTASGSTTFGTAGAGTINFQFQGAGQSTPTNVALTVTSGETVNQAISALSSAVANNGSLKAAGITLTTTTAGDALTFTSNQGQQFTVQVTGDTQNLLGFGSFITGANGAVDYNSLTGSSNYNAATAVGTDTFQISLNGAASNGNSIAVDLTGGDATAASVTGSDSSATPVSAITHNNNQLNLGINGTTYNVTLTTGTFVTKNSIANQINSAVGSNVASVVNNQVVLTSNVKGAGGSVQVFAGSANALLGFTPGAAVTGTSRSGGSVAQALNQAFAANPTLQAAGLVADYGVTQAGRITIKSNNGAYFRLDSAGSTAAAQVASTLGQLTSATSGSITGTVTSTVTITSGTNSDFNVAVDGGLNQDIQLLAGAGQTLQGIANQINSQITGAAASIDSGGHLVITSNSTGASSTIAISAGTHDATATLGLGGSPVAGAAAVNGFVINGTNDQVSVSINGGANQVFTLTHGTRTAAQIVADLQGGNGNTALTGATASADTNNHIVIQTTGVGNGTSIVFNAPTNNANAILGFTASTTYSGTQAETGYGVTGSSFTGTVSSAAPANAAQVDAGGASATTDFGFTAIVNGSDQQSVTITAPDSNGVQQSVSVTLQNNGTARNGGNIDEAISAINTALQQSNNSTLQQIVAVKDNSGGTEQIKFLSTVNSFQVSIGTTGGATGLNSTGSEGVTVTSARSAGGSTADVSTLSSAQAAVNALAGAVTTLGSAQAVVGRGENQFNYAINLANSQLTNFSAAESTIRDADLAKESANLTKAQILLQAGIAALAQANSAPQQVLALLKG